LTGVFKRVWLEMAVDAGGWQNNCGLTAAVFG
jgi:hypothetical protein